MRDMVSCFSDHAVSVSDSTCSTYAHPPLTHTHNSIQNTVVSSYRTTLSTTTLTHLLITVTWCRTHLGIHFGSDPFPHFKLNTFSRFFRKKKGLKHLDFNGSQIEISWDLSMAKFGSSPEPINGYYLIVMVESQLGLALGDLAADEVTKWQKCSIAAVKSAMVSRRECFSGSPNYCTKAQFSETGRTHEIMIMCGGDGVLCVRIDDRTVIRVKRLQWNFRGNQTVFVDGVLVDLMWDVHDWFFGSGSGHGSGYGVFMFRTRDGMDSSRLWLEEKIGRKDKENSEFSLLICASKTH